jgi:hypothetical protein
MPSRELWRPQAHFSVQGVAMFPALARNNPSRNHLQYQKFSTCFPQNSGVAFQLTLQPSALSHHHSYGSTRLEVFCSYSRRHTSRAETSDSVWVYWRCNGLDDVSSARDLSTGGLFIATASPPPAGTRSFRYAQLPSGSRTWLSIGNCWLCTRNDLAVDCLPCTSCSGLC